MFRWIIKQLPKRGGQKYAIKVRCGKCDYSHSGWAKTFELAERQTAELEQRHFSECVRSRMYKGGAAKW